MCAHVLASVPRLQGGYQAKAALSDWKQLNTGQPFTKVQPERKMSCHKYQGLESQLCDESQVWF